MKMFLAFTRKEFIHLLRDWRTMLITLITPVLLILIFGYAISTEIKNLNVMAIVPKLSASISRQLNAIDTNPIFTYKGLTDVNHLDEVLRSGTANVVIVYDRDGNYQLVVDAADANMTATRTAYISSALQTGDELGASLFQTTLRHNPQMLSAYNYVPGIMGLVFILICAIMTSTSIVREKETGTMEVLLVSPIRGTTIIAAKIMPFFTVSCINIASVLLLVHYAMGVPMQSVDAIIVVSLIYIVLSLALGLFVSTLVDKQIVALLISAMVLLLPVMMFSGMIYPLENTPWVLKPLTYVVPARWYIDAMKKLMIEGVGFNMVITEISILTGMAVLLLVVALRKFNDRLE